MVGSPMLPEHPHVTAAPERERARFPLRRHNQLAGSNPTPVFSSEDAGIVGHTAAPGLGRHHFA